jgi:hypothetical protein
VDCSVVYVCMYVVLQMFIFYFIYTAEISWGIGLVRVGGCGLIDVRMWVGLSVCICMYVHIYTGNHHTIPCAPPPPLWDSLFIYLFYLVLVTTLFILKGYVA